MKRIFILNDKVSGGGAESVMRDLVSCLCDKYDITVMTLDDDYASFQNRFPPEVTYLPSKLINNPYRRLNPLYYVVCIYNFFRKILIWSKSYDVVISNKEGPCMQLVSKMRASRKLAWIHVDYRLLYWTHWTFSAEEEVKCMQGFDHVICVSHAAAEGVKWSLVTQEICV